MVKSKVRATLRKLRTYPVFIGIVAAVCIGGLAFVAKPIIDYELCVRSSKVVLTTNPSKCLTATGRTVTNPLINEQIERIIESVRP
jgi:hypothetical protein